MWSKQYICAVHPLTCSLLWVRYLFDPSKYGILGANDPWMETFHKFLSKICISTTIHVSWPNLAKIGRCEVAEKSSRIAYKTRGQSNLTKSASRGGIPRLVVTPGGSKFVPLNFWGRGSYLVFHSNYRPRMHRLATVHARDNQPMTTDVTTQPISISASFTKVK